MSVMSVIIQLTRIYLEATRCQVRNLQFSWGGLDGRNKKHLNMDEKHWQHKRESRGRRNHCGLKQPEKGSGIWSWTFNTQQIVNDQSLKVIYWDKCMCSDDTQPRPNLNFLCKVSWASYITFPHLSFLFFKTGLINKTYPMNFSWGLSELRKVKCWKQHVAYSKLTINNTDVH